MLFSVSHLLSPLRFHFLPLHLIIVFPSPQGRYLVPVSYASFLLSTYTETQDDIEARTNEIKKLANNARNKLKSQCCFKL